MAQHSKDEQLVNVLKTLESFQLQLCYSLVRPNAYPPTFHDKESSGMDLYSPCQYVINPMEQVKIFTGVVFEFQAGWTGFIKDKSSIVTRKHLTVEGGVIDPGYRGEIIVVMRNMSNEQQIIQPRERVAQLVMVWTGHHPVLKQVDHIENNTRRGTRGFGGDYGRENLIEEI